MASLNSNMASLIDTKVLPNQLFINNEYVDATHETKLKVYNPVDGSLVADDVPVAGQADVDKAVDAAQRAFPSWRKLDDGQRRDILLRFAQLILEHSKELYYLTRLTNGRPVSQQIEEYYAAETFIHYAGWVDKVRGNSRPLNNGVLQLVHYEPFGVTAGITPWNTPLVMMAWKAAPALAAGNCFILKPSEKTPFASLALGKLIEAAKFPPGVFQVLSGDASTGALLAEHLRIRKISFTGSVLAGKKVQGAAARSNLKSVTLELGGKAPAVVFDDADLQKAVRELVDSIIMNTGQTCLAMTRVYIQADVYADFVQLYTVEMDKLGKLAGPPDDAATTIGPLVDEAQFKRVMGFVERGRKDQGKISTGGQRIGDSGFFIQPTVFTDVGPDTEIAREEVFGPVVVLFNFSTEEEVVQLCNDTNYGLNSSVFTKDINRAFRVADLLESGRVSVNCANEMSLALPFGGVKESGQGRENGYEGMMNWLESKTIYVDTKP